MEKFVAYKDGYGWLEAIRIVTKAIASEICAELDKAQWEDPETHIARATTKMENELMRFVPIGKEKEAREWFRTELERRMLI